MTVPAKIIKKQDGIFTHIANRGVYIILYSVRNYNVMRISKTASI